MIINLTDTTGSANYNVDIKPDYKPEQTQSVEYIKTTNGQTQAYNRGATEDKFRSSFAIQGLKADIFELSKKFKKSFGHAIITAEANELIFGAGIDYTNTITCNILNNGISYPQNNMALAEIPLKVEALSSNSLQIAFIAAISGVPDLYYQTPVTRIINKQETPYSAAAFGDFGTNTEVDGSGEPIFSFTVDLTFSQTQLQAAQIEKFVNTQRSTPFVWPSLTCLDLFEGQATDNVMIVGFSTSPAALDDWRLTIRIVTNV